MAAGQIAFSVLNYALAAVIWSCVGRFLLSWFVPSIQPGNYIWRGFFRVCFSTNQVHFSDSDGFQINHSTAS